MAPCGPLYSLRSVCRRQGLARSRSFGVVDEPMRNSPYKLCKIKSELLQGVDRPPKTKGPDSRVTTELTRDRYDRDFNSSIQCLAIGRCVVRNGMVLAGANSDQPLGTDLPGLEVCRHALGATLGQPLVVLG